MSRTVLTLDDINLLKFSEEPKNTELYGNLYQVLCGLPKPKAITLDQLQELDKKGIAAVTYNKQSLIDAVIEEWYAKSTSGEDPSKKAKCGLCNTPNRYLFYIVNRINKNELNVGSRCIEKFPNIEGYTEQKQQMDLIRKGHKRVSRRTKFYNEFPDVDKLISEANDYFSNIPILLPYELYSKLQDTISRMRLIFNTYVYENKKPFESKFTSFELFRLALDLYDKLKSQAETHVSKNIDNPLACKRREINWMISNTKLNLLKQISENDGIYSLSTLKQMNSKDFINDYLHLIKEKIQSIAFKFEKLIDNNIIFSFNKFGYHSPILFQIKLKDFMSNIGASCIINPYYTYGNKEIIESAAIIYSEKNLNSVLNYIYDIINKLNCVFLTDEKTNALILFRKGDRAVRVFPPRNFLVTYSKYILSSDDTIQKFLLSLIKGVNPKEWVPPEKQMKQGVYDKITKLYKDQYDDNHYVKHYNKQDQLIEIITYNLFQDKKSKNIVIDFNNPQFLKFPKNKFKYHDLRFIDYGIRVLDDSLKPRYQKNNILFIQNTQSIKNNNIIFFKFDNEILTKVCHTEKEYESIFSHIGLSKNNLQAFGRVVCHLEL